MNQFIFSKKSAKSFALVFSMFAFLSLFFQNCGTGFQAKPADVNNPSSNEVSVPDPNSGPLNPAVPLDPNAPLSVYVRNAVAKQGYDLVFKIELNRANTTDVVVDLKTVAGTAVPFVDYPDTTTSITIPAGASSVNLTLPTFNSNGSDSDKAMSLQAVSASEGLLAQKIGSATIKASQMKLKVFKQMTAGFNHTCAITAQDTVKCWGQNAYGQLGNNSTLNSSVPVDVAGLSGIKQVTAALSHTCAITAQDTVKCWGYNAFGQLGNNSTVASPVPVDVVGLSGIKQITAGSNSNYTCAITAQDTVKCWGYNFYGQLGNNSTVNSPVPVDVAGLSGIKQITAGSSHICAITAQDTVKCWGYNAYGQLGNNSTVNSPVPVDVAGLSGIKQITAGSIHTCAITAQDNVKCWGHNAYGQFGNNSNLSSSVPVDAFGLSGIKQITAGSNHTSPLRRKTT